jgi:nitrate/nitrite transport system substrate-binding protein
VSHGGPDEQPEKLFDGSVFDPKGDAEAYAHSFRVHSLKG